MTTNTRLHYLDWLRVLAFGLLIFYHTGMLYVTWSYHVKSPRIVAGVEWAMVLTNPWRLALLFFISGVASRFLLGKLGAGRFARDRIARLLPALVFGMIVVVPPQTYFEVVQHGRWSGGYLQFWIEHYLAADRALGVAVPTWNHLWFLAYLLVYCLAFAAVSAVWSRRPVWRLRSSRNKWPPHCGWGSGGGVAHASPGRARGEGPGLAGDIGRPARHGAFPAKCPIPQSPNPSANHRDGTPEGECPMAILLLGPGIWMAVTNVLASELRPDTHALVDDWAAHLRWIGIFVAGLLAARCGPFWALLRRRRHALAALSLVLGGVLTAVRVLLHAGHIGERWDGPAYGVASGTFGWTAILAIVGMASHHLRGPSRALSYLNTAILPIYMLHQTVLIMIAVALFPLGLPLWLEGGLIAIGTLGASAAIYESAIRRWSPLRFLFGLKREGFRTDELPAGEAVPRRAY